MTAKKILFNQIWNLTEDQTEKVLYAMKEYARIKCLKAIKNTRHKSIEVLLANDYYDLCKDHMHEIEEDYILPENEIMNIRNEDVMPEL